MTTLPIWAGRYIGIPFLEHGRTDEGLDCWGLVRLIYMREFATRLKSYTHLYQDTCQSEELGDLIEEEAKGWQEVQAEEAIIGDVVVLRMRGRAMHVGIVLGGGKFMHAAASLGVVMENYCSQRWVERVEGFYRYKE